MHFADMDYISARKTRLQNRLARTQSVLTALYATFDEMATQGVSSYKFDSGEGSQSANRKSSEEIANLIERYEAEEEHYINELACMGLVVMQLRRKS